MEVCVYKINSIQANNKYLCLIAEKCYNVDYRTLIVLSNDDMVRKLDDNLWTFSRDSFMPHEHEISNINLSKIFLITNEVLIDLFHLNSQIASQSILETMASYDAIIMYNININLVSIKDINLDNFPKLKKFIIVFDDSVQQESLLDVLKNYQQDPKNIIKCYQQTINGQWIQESY